MKIKKKEAGNGLFLTTHLQFMTNLLPIRVLQINCPIPILFYLQKAEHKWSAQDSKQRQEGAQGTDDLISNRISYPEFKTFIFLPKGPFTLVQIPQRTATFLQR